MRRHVMTATRVLAAVLVVASMVVPRNLAAVLSPSNAPPCVVERVVDGDTIRCRGGLRVRLLLIDTPERSQRPFGPEATAALKRLLPVGSAARLELDVQAHDRYGRTLAYVYTSRGLMVNEELVRTGFAVVLVYPPNVRYVDRLRAAAAEAQRARRGLWARSGFECLPKDHRARRC